MRSASSSAGTTIEIAGAIPRPAADCLVGSSRVSGGMRAPSRSRHRVHAAVRVLAVLIFAAALGHATPCRAGFDVVRFEGVIGQSGLPDSVGDLTLAIGDKSLPYCVLKAQKISGNPATGPEIFSALGPGPPPLRVEGRDAAVAKITGASPGTRLVITGNLNAGNAFLTLMDVEAAPAPSPAQ